MINVKPEVPTLDKSWVTIDSLGMGDTFIYNEGILMMTDDDPKAIYLCGNNIGMMEEWSCETAANIHVQEVNVNMTWKLAKNGKRETQ